MTRKERRRRRRGRKGDAGIKYTKKKKKNTVHSVTCCVVDSERTHTQGKMQRVTKKGEMTSE